MMTIAEAAQQINRLSPCGGWRELPNEGKVELATQMAALFQNKAHAARAIDRWLRNNRWVPTVVDLVELAIETDDRPKVTPDRRCPSCSGVGFREGWVLETYLGGIDRNGAPLCKTEQISEEAFLRRKPDDTHRYSTCAVACECEYGQHLLAARRKADREATVGGKK